MSIASSTNSTEELRFPDIFREFRITSGAMEEIFVGLRRRQNITLIAQISLYLNST